MCQTLLNSRRDNSLFVTAPVDCYHNFGCLETLAFTQYTMRKGLQVFGDRGVEGVSVELRQLHERRVIAPIKGEQLSIEEKHRVLNYLMFLEQERCSRIKGRTDGRK